MPRKIIKDYKVPSYFKAILQDFTINFIMEEPPNIADFGIRYFQNMKIKYELRLREEDLEESFRLSLPNFNRRKSICAEQWDPEINMDDVTIRTEKTDIEKQVILEQLKTLLLSKYLGDDEIMDIINAMFVIKVKGGERIIKQGDDGDFFYIIQSGLFEATVTTEKGDEELVKLYSNSGSFGELALMYNVPRMATVRAKTDGILWVMDRKSFQIITKKNAFKKRKFFENIIDNVPILSVLGMEEKLKVFDALILKTYNDGDCIIHQGDVADGMYFIESGAVKIMVKTIGNREVRINTLSVGDYFGELALITHQRRSASVYAEGTVKVGYLEIEAFERLLGPCVTMMTRNVELYKAQMDMLIEKDKIRQ